MGELMTMTDKKIQPCLTDVELKADEYINDDGMICCSVCKKPRYTVWKMFGQTFTFRENCECQAKEEEIRKNEEEKKALQDKIEQLKAKSMLAKKFQTAKFENTDLSVGESFNKAFGICQSYCNSKEALDNGYGLYIYGNCGVGKTHLTACIANELMEKHLQSVIFTTFSDIDRQVKATMDCGGDNSVIRLLTNVDYLFIDDLGTERIINAQGQELMLQQTIYDIINGRYTKCKPIVITSNFSLNDLIAKTGIMQKTVDRIYEMATRKLEITGDSYRLR